LGVWAFDGVSDLLVEVVDFTGEFDGPAGQQSQGVCGGGHWRVGLVRVEVGASADECGVAEFGHGVTQGRVGPARMALSWLIACVRDLVAEALASLTRRIRST